MESRSMQRWTRVEDDMLRSQFNSVDRDVLACMLNRSRKSIYFRAKMLGLVECKPEPIPDDDRIRELRASGMSIVAIAEVTGATKAHVQRIVTGRTLRRFKAPKYNEPRDKTGIATHSIIALMLSHANHGAKELDFDFEPIRDHTFKPTQHPAGSDEKIEELQRRVANGQPLWHDDDSQGVLGRKTDEYTIPEVGLSRYEHRVTRKGIGVHG